MTKHDLFKEVENSIKITEPTRLDYCSACTYEAIVYNRRAIVLQSYATIVSVYFPASDVLVVRDCYSTTTSKHVSKFINKTGAFVVLYLYRRSDRVVERFGSIDTIKATKSQFEKIYNEDFETLLTSILW